MLFPGGKIKPFNWLQNQKQAQFKQIIQVANIHRQRIILKYFLKTKN